MLFNIVFAYLDNVKSNVNEASDIKPKPRSSSSVATNLLFLDCLNLNFFHFSITFLAALLPCCQCFHRTGIELYLRNMLKAHFIVQIFKWPVPGDLMQCFESVGLCRLTRCNATKSSKHTICAQKFPFMSSVKQEQMQYIFSFCLAFASFGEKIDINI